MEPAADLRLPIRTDSEQQSEIFSVQKPKLRQGREMHPVPWPVTFPRIMSIPQRGSDNAVVYPAREGGYERQKLRDNAQCGKTSGSAGYRFLLAASRGFLLIDS